MSILVYDIEILRGIPHKTEPKEKGIAYCEGWHDKANMGVTCIGAYDEREDRYRVFTEGTFEEFEWLAKERTVVGFNSLQFDDVVCWHSGLTIRTDWDLLLEQWRAAGLGDEFDSTTHANFGLNATAKANGFGEKTGWGGSAPVDWQRGLYGKVIDYCLQDVRLTWRLVEQARRKGYVVDPRDTTKLLRLDVSGLRGEKE